MRRIAVLMILAAGLASAQTAVVIELSTTDAERAQKAWDTLQRAQEEWATVKQSVSDKYVTGQTIASHGVGVPEWASGFEFSKDFKVIVPKTAQTTGTITVGPYTTGPVWNPPCGGFSTCPGTACFQPTAGGARFQ